MASIKQGQHSVYIKIHLTPMWTETLDKFHTTQHILASQQENVAALSLKTEADGDLFKT